jgi:hypothetical protein
MCPAFSDGRVGPRRVAILVIPVIVIVYIVLAYGAYSVFTSQIPSGNDFYPRWRGTRSLILEGKDPYSDEVTLEIQQGMYGRPAREDEDQVAFAYPLYVSLLVLPFSFFPYPQAQALWMSTLILLTLTAVVIMARTFDWKFSLIGLVALSLWCVFFYPTARSILLGQISIVVLALVVTALWAVQRGHPVLAGFCLALSTVKPQMVFLVIPFLLLTALRSKNYRVVAAFLAPMTALLLVSFLVLPTWLRSFIAGLSRYQAYTSIYREGKSPLGVLISYLLPSEATSWVTVLICLALVGCLAYVWAKALVADGDTSQALFLTVILTLVVPAETGTSNQVLLLLPFVAWLSQERHRPWMAIAASVILLTVPWVLFLWTVQGDLEHPMMAVPLPFFAMAILFWRNGEAGRQRQSAKRMRTATPPK